MLVDMLVGGGIDWKRVIACASNKSISISEYAAKF